MCVWVFGLLVVNSEINLNGSSFNLSPQLIHTHKHKHTHKELVYWMRNGVLRGVLRILSGVCLCVCTYVCERVREYLCLHVCVCVESERLIRVKRHNLSARAL